MRVLVIGGGGREHVLCWKLRQSSRVEKIYAVPGNAGMAEVAECEKIEYENNFSSLGRLIDKEKIDFVIVGPELPLVNGIADYLEKKKVAVFGPSKKAALLEGSKVFAKKFMKKYGIPTADFEIFTDLTKAIAYIKKEGPRVIKVDGLAAGKGVFLPNTKEEAIEAIELAMEKGVFGEAGKRIVIEEKLKGRELSFIVITDGKSIKPLVSSRDYKPIYERGKGPNTGGMGAYSPAFVPFSLYKKIMKQIVIPTLKGMKKEKREFKGVLYAGLMIENGNPKVLEYNVRLGDPETQVILPRLKNDLLDILLAAREGTLDRINLRWHSQAAVCVVLASGGYPGSYEKGKPIMGLEKLFSLNNVFPFCAGVKRGDSSLITDGGRVVGITAVGDNLNKAAQQAYRAIDKVHFERMYYRRDIGKGRI
ncbi:phosphoribosylamine--glycine ligase [Candidatus Aerophobetes bacterium]|uniref:Phosphoribosylamine--glycine ligase n=1 Tax=Aerophobetes bacterium TaxID=2030807 RepID=A0A523ZIP2_UNCAE|nr:MAG: phosphoribosylamine--glycine ligase [Candidatus Aerophobetes bacterium]